MTGRHGLSLVHRNRRKSLLSSWRLRQSSLLSREYCWQEYPTWPFTMRFRYRASLISKSIARTRHCRRLRIGKLNRLLLTLLNHSLPHAKVEVKLHGETTPKIKLVETIPLSFSNFLRTFFANQFFSLSIFIAVNEFSFQENSSVVSKENHFARLIYAKKI